MIALKGSGACRRMEGVAKPGLGKGPLGIRRQTSEQYLWARSLNNETGSVIRRGDSRGSPQTIHVHIGEEAGPRLGVAWAERVLAKKLFAGCEAAQGSVCLSVLPTRTGSSVSRAAFSSWLCR